MFTQEKFLGSVLGHHVPIPFCDAKHLGIKFKLNSRNFIYIKKLKISVKFVLSSIKFYSLICRKLCYQSTVLNSD